MWYCGVQVYCKFYEYNIVLTVHGKYLYTYRISSGLYHGIIYLPICSVVQ